MPVITIPTNDCGCKSYNPCVQTTTTTLDTGCPINLDCSCVFYHLKGDGASNLTNLALPNGTDLDTILDAIDDKLQAIDPTFPEYTSVCINYPGFIMSTMEEFQAGVDDEFCTIKTDFSNLSLTLTGQFATLTTLVNTINTPAIQDACGLNIQSTDSIAQVLTKLKDGYCLLSANTFSDNSPVFAPVESASVSWLSGGVKGHTPIANVKKSAFAGNSLQILSDGLYVGDVATSTQVLSLNPTTRVISLSNGGGNITLPADKDFQTLTLNTALQTIAISNGNTIDLTPIIPVFNQEDITPTNTNTVAITATGTANTDISADVKVSATSGNIISVNSDGLYVPTPATSLNDKVKADAADTAAGYLIDKVEGATDGVTAVSVAYNAGGDKITVSAHVDPESLLSAVDADTSSNDFFDYLVAKGMCFRFKVVNTDGALAKTYSYKDCAGNTVTGVSLSSGASVVILAKGVFSSDVEVNIYNLGFNF